MSDIGDPQDGQQAAAGAAGAAAGLVAAAAAVVAMPLRNERIAPVFNEIGSGLKRYFNDFEALIRRAGITDDNEKKVQSTYYLSVDTQDLWESQPSFSDASTYAQFKSAIFKLYPGSDDAAKFVRKDLDDYVASTLVKGIKNREEYGQYSRTMQYMGRHLLDRGVISENELRRSFITGLPDALRAKVALRLSIKASDTPADTPYAIPDVDEAAQWFLLGSGSDGSNVAATGLRLQDDGRGDGQRVAPSQPPPAFHIKPEDFQTMMGQIQRTLNRLEQQARPPPATFQPTNYPPANFQPQPPPHVHVYNEPPRQSGAPQRSDAMNCFFCGKPDCRIANCPDAAAMLREGKCIKNAENNYVLPGGGYPPSIRGATLKARIEEYHRQNPGQLAKGSLMFDIVDVLNPYEGSSSASAGDPYSQSASHSSLLNQQTGSSYPPGVRNKFDTTELKRQRERLDISINFRERAQSLANTLARNGHPLPPGIYSTAPKTTSQFQSAQYASSSSPIPQSSSSRGPSIPNSRAILARDAPPHMSFAASITEVDGNDEVTESTRDEFETAAFIASSRAERQRQRQARQDNETRENTIRNSRTRMEPVVEIEQRRSGPRKTVRVATPQEDPVDEDSGNVSDATLFPEDNEGEREEPSPEVEEIARPATAPSSQVTRPNTPPQEHPFANSRDALYAPPTVRNIGALPRPSRQRNDPSYHNVVPIISGNPAVSKAIMDRSLDLPINVTLSELLALSPDLRKLYRDATTPKRVPAVSEGTTTRVFTLNESSRGSTSGIDPAWNLDDFYDNQQVIRPQQSSSAGPSGSTDTSSVTSSFVMQTRDTYVATDPYEDHIRSLPPGAPPPIAYTVVADESVHLRCVFPVVEGEMPVECVVDPGCQIIAMNELIANQLGLQYDPTIILHMQSANGSMDNSLGLARDVAFRFGDITIYLQVHILRNPAYDVLLGRPFDTLTESVIKNFRNEDTSITITCPNSNRKATIPTKPRGVVRKISKPAFPRSMM